MTPPNAMPSDLNVVRAANLWNAPNRLNSWDISKLLRVTEPQALSLLHEARVFGLIAVKL